MKLLIMIPAYNEALNIRQVVQHLQSICPEYDYLIINDGSRDATAAFAARTAILCWICR